MKKNILLLIAAILSFSATYSQVGINTQSPLVGLHVVPFSTDGSTAEGIIAPNLTRAQLIAKDARYTATHKGAFVYITAVDGTVTTKTAKITTTGYYYFDGTEWKHFNDKLQNADNGLSVNNATVQLGGNLTKATVVAQGANPMSITSTNTSASSAIFGNNNAALRLDAANKGFMPPRIALKSNTDNTTIPVSAADKGMVVYHTDNTKMEEGLYSWNGASWKQLITQVPVAPITTANILNLLKAVSSLPAHGGTTHLGINMPFGALESDGKYYLTIPEAGSYAFAFRIFGNTVLTSPSVTFYPRTQTYYVNIVKNNTILDVAELSAVVMKRNEAATSAVQGFTTVLACANLQAGDKIEFRCSHLENICTPLNLSSSTNNANAARTSLAFWKL